MVETSATSDMSKGLVMVFGAITFLAAVGVAGSAYQSSVAANGDTMQLLSGVFMTAALLAACIAVAVVHIYK